MTGFSRDMLVRAKTHTERFLRLNSSCLVAIYYTISNQTTSSSILNLLIACTREDMYDSESWPRFFWVHSYL